MPCSGYGVIRRKPEIRYKPLSSVRELPALQFRILENGASLVKPGGLLLYATCTLNPAENQQVASRFLEAHPEFEPAPFQLPGGDQAAGGGQPHGDAAAVQRRFRRLFRRQVPQKRRPMSTEFLDPRDIKSLTLPELQQALGELGCPKFRAGQVFRWLSRGVADFSQMSDPVQGPA